MGTRGHWSALAVAMLGAAGCVGESSASRSGRRDGPDAIGDLLGSAVLTGKPGLEVYVHRPSPDREVYTAYARFDGDEVAFRSLSAALGLGGQGTPASGGNLPASWALPEGVTLPWWDAGTDTPEVAGARSHGRAGWIVAKQEHGHVHLIVTDAM
jgi:hypothetical protein